MGLIIEKRLEKEHTEQCQFIVGDLEREKGLSCLRALEHMKKKIDGANYDLKRNFNLRKKQKAQIN